MLKSEAGARSLEHFLAKYPTGRQPDLHIDLKSKRLIFTPEWAYSCIRMATSYRHLQSMAISHRLDLKAGYEILKSISSTLTSLEMQIHPEVAHASWECLRHLQRLSLGLDDSNKVFSCFCLKQLPALTPLTTLTFRGPGRGVIRAETFSLTQLQMPAMEDNPFYGHLDLAGFPRLANVRMRGSARHVEWLLHHPIPKLTFVATGFRVQLFPASLEDRLKELQCSVLCMDFTSTHGGVNVEQLEKMPHLKPVEIQSSKETKTHSVCAGGAFSTYWVLLQRVKIRASGGIELGFLTDEVRDTERGAIYTPWMSNGHSKYCQCAPCSLKHLDSEPLTVALAFLFSCSGGLFVSPRVLQLKVIAQGVRRAPASWASDSVPANWTCEMPCDVCQGLLTEPQQTVCQDLA